MRKRNDDLVPVKEEDADLVRDPVKKIEENGRKIHVRPGEVVVAVKIAKDLAERMSTM